MLSLNLYFVCYRSKEALEETEMLNDSGSEFTRLEKSDFIVHKKFKSLKSSLI